MILFSLDACHRHCYLLHMERRRLQYHEAFVEIYGDPAAVVSLFPDGVSAQIVAPETVTACIIPDLSCGGRKNLAHLRMAGSRVVISGCAPAVAFLLSQWAASSQTDSSPRPAAALLTVYFLTTPVPAPHERRVTCFAPRPGNSRRGRQIDIFDARSV